MIKIVADTLSCLSLDQAKALDIPLIPQIIEFGGESFRDDTEMDGPTFLAKLQVSPTIPKTAAPPPALYEPIFRKAFEAGDTVIVVCPSAEVSGTVRSAQVAAQDFPEANIRVVDTKSIGVGLGTLVETAVQWASQGLDADAIEHGLLEMAPCERIYFLLDTLEYLQRGGRIGKARALFGSLLQMKPILTFKEGHTEPVESQRTKRKAIARLIEIVLSECPKGDISHIKLMHGNAEDDAKYLNEELRKALGINQIPLYFLPPAILVHSGPGALGVSFFRA
jgi:DegV family protein with EDD domain